MKCITELTNSQLSLQVPVTKRPFCRNTTDNTIYNKNSLPTTMGTQLSTSSHIPISNPKYHMRAHLRNVYACLAMTTMSAAAGAYTQFFTNLSLGGKFMLGLTGLGCGIALSVTPDNGENKLSRITLLLGFGYFAGLSTSPILQTAINANPDIITNAMVLSGITFTYFSGIALVAPSKKYLYIGGTLSNGLSVLMSTQYLNMFLRSHTILQMCLWGGTLLFCGLTLWDTQRIIEKYKRGDDDFISHSLELFINLLQIFRKLLALLLHAENKKNTIRRKISVK